MWTSRWGRDLNLDTVKKEIQTQTKEKRKIHYHPVSITMIMKHKTLPHSLEGRGVWGRMDTCICVAESPSVFTWNYHNTASRLCCSATQSCLTLPCLEPARLLCPWNLPGKNNGVGSHLLLQGNLPDPEIKPVSAALQADSLSLNYQGSPNQVHSNTK